MSFIVHCKLYAFALSCIHHVDNISSILIIQFASQQLLSCHAITGYDKVNNKKVEKYLITYNIMLFLVHLPSIILCIIVCY